MPLLERLLNLLGGRDRMLRILIFLWLIALTAGCSPGGSSSVYEEISYENQTGHIVQLSISGEVLMALGPWEERSRSLQKFPGSLLFEARVASGWVIYSESLTWNDLNSKGIIVVINQPPPPAGLPPPCERDAPTSSFC